MEVAALYFILYICCLLPGNSQASPWVWTCAGGENHTCLRVLPDELGADTPMDLMECKMTCGDDGVLWPLPTVSHTMDKTLAAFTDPTVFNMDSVLAGPQVESLLRSFYNDVFLGYLQVMRPVTKRNIAVRPHQAEVVFQVAIGVTVAEELANLTPETDESYTLELVPPNGGTIRVIIESQTFYGARHALETLSQLISFNRMTGLYQMHSSAFISDAPRYSHRGLSLDTARTFFPLDTLKLLLDGMAHNKLNVLHWHLSDSQSFPLRLPSVPQLAEYGAYSDDMVYETEDARELVEYAKVRGIKIVPELDAPAHSANGWQFGEMEGLGKLALCINQRVPRCRGGVCGNLNPTNPQLYTVLRAIYGDLLDIFTTTDLVHMGGDEVNFSCWSESPEVQVWFQQQGLEGNDEDMFMLWSQFQANASTVLFEEAAARGRDCSAVMWTSSLTVRSDADVVLPAEDYHIQVWSDTTDESYSDLINRGYNVIVSPENRWYLDCGLGNWAGKLPSHCDPFKQWEDVYDFDPRRDYLALPAGDPSRVSQILGGEGALWSEFVGPATLEGRAWPRAAALAERLWTAPEDNWKGAETRLVHQRERMAQRGIGADVAQMYWCHLNEGSCRCQNDDCS